MQILSFSSRETLQFTFNHNNTIIVSIGQPLLMRVLNLPAPPRSDGVKKCMLNLLVCGDPSFTGAGRFSKAGSW